MQFADAAGFRECAKTQATLYPGFVDPDHQKTFAYAAVDGEDTDHAVQWLMTAPEFGCVQFAAKE